MDAEAMQAEIDRIHAEHEKKIKRIRWMGLVRGILAGCVGSGVGIVLAKGPVWAVTVAAILALAWVAHTMWWLRPRRCDVCRAWTQLPPDEDGTVLCQDHWFARMWRMFGDAVVRQIQPPEPGAPTSSS